GRREFGAGDEVVDVGQHFIEAVINGVDVDRDGDAVLARDGGGVGDGSGVMAIDVEHAGAGDLLGVDLFRVDAEAVVGAPEHGALAGRAVDDDVGGLVG